LGDKLNAVPQWAHCRAADEAAVVRHSDNMPQPTQLSLARNKCSAGIIPAFSKSSVCGIFCHHQMPRMLCRLRMWNGSKALMCRR